MNTNPTQSWVPTSAPDQNLCLEVKPPLLTRLGNSNVGKLNNKSDLEGALFGWIFGANSLVVEHKTSGERFKVTRIDLNPVKLYVVDKDGTPTSLDLTSVNFLTVRP